MLATQFFQSDVFLCIGLVAVILMVGAILFALLVTFDDQNEFTHPAWDLLRVPVCMVTLILGCAATWFVLTEAIGSPEYPVWGVWTMKDRASRDVLVPSFIAIPGFLISVGLSIYFFASKAYESTSCLTGSSLGPEKGPETGPREAGPQKAMRVRRRAPVNDSSAGCRACSGIGHVWLNLAHDAGSMRAICSRCDGYGRS